MMMQQVISWWRAARVCTA